MSGSDESHGDSELLNCCLARAYCSQCRFVAPVTEFTRVGGSFGALRCSKCGSFRVAIEGTGPPDDSLCEITLVAPGDKPWAETIKNTLMQKEISVGEGGLAQVVEASGVVVTVPRALMFMVIAILDDLRVEWAAPLVRTPDAAATQDEVGEESA